MRSDSLFDTIEAGDSLNGTQGRTVWPFIILKTTADVGGLLARTRGNVAAGFAVGELGD